MISYAAMQNAEKSPLTPEITLVDAKKELAKDLQMISDQIAHLRFLNARLDGSTIDYEQPKQIKLTESDEEREVREEEKFLSAARGLAARLNKSVFTAQETEYPRKEGEKGFSWCFLCIELTLFRHARLFQPLQKVEEPNRQVQRPILVPVQARKRAEPRKDASFARRKGGPEQKGRDVLPNIQSESARRRARHNFPRRGTRRVQ